jgi:hypothetical protein
MLISDYASAFFFARRTRVTFRSPAHLNTVAIFWIVHPATRKLRFHSIRKNTELRDRSHSVKARKNFGLSKNTAQKTKARQCRAFAVVTFWLVYFASLAI